MLLTADRVMAKTWAGLEQDEKFVSLMIDLTKGANF
jgi:hypothetical protein